MFGWLRAKMGPVVLLAIMVVGLGVYLGFGIRRSRYAPPNAIVLVDPITEFFYPQPCAPADGEGIWMTLSKAHEMGYELDSACRAEGLLFQEDRSLSGSLLESIGILPPIESRWNADGSWRW